jgi:predicted transport protein
MSTEELKKAELSQIRNLEEKTGKTLAEWISIARESGKDKHGEIVSYLKTTHGLGHGYANLVVHHAKQSHAGAEANDTDWIAEQYKGRETLQQWYDAIMKAVLKLGNDIEIAPKKAYVSLRRKKQFAIIQPSTKTRLDIGLNMKGVAPAGALEASGSWNSMCTHRVKIESDEAIGAELIGWIRQAYEQAG